MDKKRLFGSVCCTALIAASCSQGGNNLHGTAGPSYEGCSVTLCDPYSLEVIDSATVSGRRFAFCLPQTPVAVYLLRASHGKDDPFPVSLPVVGGEGPVRACIGSKVQTAGTPLNEAMQDFLIAADRERDSISATARTADEAGARFRDFLKGQARRHAGTVVGDYILRAYASRFTPEDLQELQGKDETND